MADHMEIDFIGIGCPKCGTTKIASLLREHPEICLSEPKSLTYFNKQTSYYQNAENPNYNQGIENYYKHFAHRTNEKICGEFTTVYIYEEGAAKLIKSHIPKVKLLLCLRNPIDRIVSHYQWLVYFLQVEKRSISELIREEEELIDKSLYAKHLSKYYEIFDQDQIYIILMEDFFRNPNRELVKLYDFLNVDSHFVPENLNHVENGKRYTRSIGISKLYGKFVEIMVNSGNSHVLEKLRKMPIRKLYQKLNSKEIPDTDKLSKTDIDYIHSKVNPDIVELEQLIGVDLTVWKEKYSNN